MFLLYPAFQLKRQIVGGIYVRAFVGNGKMQMGTGRRAGRSHIANNLTLAHLLTHGNDVMGHMQVHRAEAVTVVDAYIVAAAGTVGSGGNRTAFRRVNGCAGGTCQVHTVVEFFIAVNGMDTGTVGTGQRPVRARLDPAAAGGCGCRGVRGILGIIVWS